MALQLVGVDFTCAPSRRKPITVARGTLARGGVRLSGIDALNSLDAFDALLAEPGPWLGAFDFPFGLPRAFVDAQGLGIHGDVVITELRRRCPTRLDWRAMVDRWSHGRPAGQRLLHRRTDTAMPGLSSSSPLQTRYVPVGFMYYEGFWRLVGADLTIPRLRFGDPARVAVEGYPGLLAHELIGRRSYKNQATADRRAAREDIVAALLAGHGRLGLRLCASAGLRERMVDDIGGDALDAVLCLMQAAWASTRDEAGLPPDVDPVEGWIATVP